ncbi:MAG: NAD(P)/FAD-dependent oxidoreductase [Oscillospiraceae bacterium]|nr:NAD(P)/FAD-dependent oxidoreductase [Oscillospiraceae bacterium]
MKTAVIIGGGASGMMAALTAAEKENIRVILIERQQRVGRKLLATGNGRCNLTNIYAGPANYHGEQPGFADFALEKFTPQNTLDFFAALGLVTVTEDSGRVYPLSDSANSVVDVLRFALDERGVEVRCGVSVRALFKKDGGYTVSTDGGDVYADYVVVACGGAAGEKLGGVMDGYEILKNLGHKRTRLYPSLVQLITASDYPRALKGVRADARLSLFCGDELMAESVGELQFTEKGISGPVSFDVSRAAAVLGEEGRLSVDFMRNFDENTVRKLLTKRRDSFPKLECAELFTGMLHNRLGRMLIKYARLNPSTPLGSLKDADIEAAVSACKGFHLPLCGTEGFDKAQVTAGGIKTGGVDPQTMQSWFMPNLFICGELLDVDGDCGGFNLQWAWASGRMAGRLGE